MKTERTSKKLFTPARIGGSLLFVAALIPLFMGTGDSTATTDSSAPKITWVSFDEGVKLAQQNNKKMIVDVYTDWCTWCKKMDATTYASEGVRSELARNFVAVKLNAEASKKLTFQGSLMTETQFAQSAGITGYPSTLFLDASLKPITIVPGYVPPERFEIILKYIGTDQLGKITFQQYVEQQSKLP